MKHTYKYLLVILVAAVVTACNLNINDDPNRVTETTVTGELIFPAGATEVGVLRGTQLYNFLNDWIGYFSGSGGFALDATETSYNITPSFGNTLWLSDYNTLFDLHQSEVKALASGDTVLAAADMILEADVWQDVVDVFGNVPYTQAFNYGKYPNPAYDKAQDIYADLQKRLDLAISYMGKPAPTAFTGIDIVNQGSESKWIKFANSLKLRMLIRQSEIPGFSATDEIAKIQAHGGVLHAGETVSVQPGYTNSTNKQSPFWASYGETVSGNDAAPSVRANLYFVNLLTSHDDPRLPLYFLPSGGTVIGTNYGSQIGNPITSSGVGRGLAKSAGQAQWLFTSVESLFNEAEAIQRGWITGDNATAYTAAIHESFVFLGVNEGTVPNTDSTFNAYMTENPYTPGITPLLFAKYQSLCGIAPVEVWSDLRRMNYAFIPAGYLTKNTAATSSTPPVRLLYPQNEYSTNATAVAAEGTIDQFTSKIFWDVN